MMLVTLEEAKDHLEVDFSSKDTMISLKVSSASGMVLNYLKSRRNLYVLLVDDDGEPLLDSQGEVVYELDSQGARIVRDEIKHAVLILVGMLFRDRDGVEAKDWAPGFLPAPVTAILYPLRDPALA
jgi:Phage gp6-like head-tail connector protein